MEEISHWLQFAPLDHNKLNWFDLIHQDLRQLEDYCTHFKVDAAFKDEEFLDMFMLATRYAMLQRKPERIRVLRNAVLNSVLSGYRDNHELFIRWAGELTTNHVQVLRRLEKTYEGVHRLIPASIHWFHAPPAGNRNTRLQGDAFRASSERVVKDLYKKGLVRYKKTATYPIITELARQFLAFIERPF